jgi:hypothetical protein
MSKEEDDKERKTQQNIRSQGCQRSDMKQKRINDEVLYSG